MPSQKITCLVIKLQKTEKKKHTEKQITEEKLEKRMKIKLN